MDIFDKILRGSFINMIFKFLSVGVAFIIAKVFIVNYGQEAYAIWLLDLAIVSYLSVVINGVPGGVLKYFSENEVDNKPQENVVLYYDTILLYSLAGILSCAIVFLFADSIVDLFSISYSDHLVLVQMLKYSMSLLVFIWPLYVAENIFQALMRYDTINLYKSSGLIVGAVSLWMSLELNLDIVYLPIVYFAPQLLAMLLLNLKLSRVINLKMKYDLDLKRLRALLTFIGPLILVELSSLLSYEGEKLMIANRLDMKALAEYSIITLVPLNVRAFYGILTISVLPAVFKLAYVGNDDGIERILSKGSRFLFIFLSPVILGVVLLSTEILNFFIAENESYLDYKFYFELMCLLLLFLLPYSAFISRVLIGMSRIKFILYFTLIINAIKLSLIYFISKDYGIESIFIISIIVSLIGGLMIGVYAVKTIPINWRNYFKDASKNIFGFLLVCSGSKIFLKEVDSILIKSLFVLVLVTIYFLLHFNNEVNLRKIIRNI